MHSTSNIAMTSSKILLISFCKPTGGSRETEINDFIWLGYIICHVGCLTGQLRKIRSYTASQRPYNHHKLYIVTVVTHFLNIVTKVCFRVQWSWMYFTLLCIVSYTKMTNLINFEYLKMCQLRSILLPFLCSSEYKVFGANFLQVMGYTIIYIRDFFNIF